MTSPVFTHLQSTLTMRAGWTCCAHGGDPDRTSDAMLVRRYLLCTYWYCRVPTGTALCVACVCRMVCRTCHNTQITHQTHLACVLYCRLSCEVHCGFSKWGSGGLSFCVSNPLPLKRATHAQGEGRNKSLPARLRMVSTAGREAEDLRMCGCQGVQANRVKP